MKISSKEADILSCVELRAELPIKQIRKETGYREHTIRYHIHSLESRGIINKRPFINLEAMGLTEYNIFFSLPSERTKLKQDLMREFAKIREIIWVAEFGGDSQYGIDICARSIHEVHDLLHRISTRFGNIFFHKKVSALYSAIYLPRGYLSNKKFQVKPLALIPTKEIAKTDELDSRILESLVKHGSSSHRRVAQEIRVPLSTLELRVKKLEESGVIQGYFYDVDLRSYGVSSYKLLVYARGISPALSKRLLEFCYSHPNIVVFFECFGSWDYEIGVEVYEPQQVVSITQELYENFAGDLVEIRTLSKFGVIKYTPYPLAA